MRIAELGAHYRQQLDVVAELATHALWQNEALDTLARAAQDFTDTDGMMQVMHEMQRLNKIHAAGLADNHAFKADIVKANIPTWKNFGSPPAALDLQHSLAEKLYNPKPGKDFAMLNLGDGAREIGKWLVDKCIAENVPFVVNLNDYGFDGYVMHHADEDGVKALAAAYLRKTAPVTTIMTARPGLPDKEYKVKVGKAKSHLYSHEVKPFSEKTGTGEVFYTLTVIPTKKDAAIDGIDYDEYVKLFFEMCDQPWDLIGKAQEELIKEFNAATKVRITNDDGTDISMELVDHDGSHFTFCNSLIAKNVPGSEIFSAMRRDSLEGKVVAKGKFSEHGADLIENLTMEFEKGKLVRYHADKGVENFEKAIGVDDGAKFCGELGIGTNPHLKTHVANGLLVEKIGGSFHLALGRAYSYTEYQGVKVKVDNGNKSALHWDITTMLHGKNGRIYLDGRLVMDDGKWLENKYDILNRGWEAVPEAKRPVYWQNYYKNRPSV